MQQRGRTTIPSHPTGLQFFVLMEKFVRTSGQSIKRGGIDKEGGAGPYIL
jgi:hypothetical protein